jgi:hypothetical protein
MRRGRKRLKCREIVAPDSGVKLKTHWHFRAGYSNLSASVGVQRMELGGESGED